MLRLTVAVTGVVAAEAFVDDGLRAEPAVHRVGEVTYLARPEFTPYARSFDVGVRFRTLRESFWRLRA